MSADPILGSYLPIAGNDKSKLPSEGGIFNPINLSTYTYAANNPLKYIDPDGKKSYLIIWATSNGEIGHAGFAVDNYRRDSKGNMVPDGTLTYYDLWPGNVGGVGKKNCEQNVQAFYGERTTTLNQIITTDISGSEGYAPDGVIELKTDYVADQRAVSEIKKFKSINIYNGKDRNCSDLAKVGVEAALGKNINADESILGRKATTPNKLFRETMKDPQAKVIKDPGNKVDNDFIQGILNKTKK